MPRLSNDGIRVQRSAPKPSALEQQQPRKKSRSENKENTATAGPEEGIEAGLLKRVLDIVRGGTGGVGTPVATSDGAAEAAEKAIDAARAEATFWKGQFETLRQLRETEPERALWELREGVRSQQKRAEALAVELRSGDLAAGAGAAKVAEVSGAVASSAETPAKEGLKEAGEEESTDIDEDIVEELEAKLDEKRELIKAYQRLTGVVITLADEDEEDDEAGARTVQCTAINHIHKRVTKFDLLLPAAATEPGGKTGHATFVPTANKQLLPLNLREAARLDPNQLPVLFQRLLKQLYTTEA